MKRYIDMLPKVNELIFQIISTKDTDVKEQCIFDLMEYQSIKTTEMDLVEYIAMLDQNQGCALMKKLTNLSIKEVVKELNVLAVQLDWCVHYDNGYWLVNTCAEARGIIIMESQYANDINLKITNTLALLIESENKNRRAA